MIQQGMTSSFKKELALAIHDFSLDTFKIALYSSSASLGADTTAYTASSEITGTGYSAGGATLTAAAPVLDGTTVVLDFSDITWAASQLTARGALIYNSSKANRSVAVLDFGSDKTMTNFAIVFPAATAAAAVLRII